MSIASGIPHRKPSDIAHIDPQLFLPLEHTYLIGFLSFFSRTFSIYSNYCFNNTLPTNFTDKHSFTTYSIIISAWTARLHHNFKFYSVTMSNYNYRGTSGTTSQQEEPMR